MHTSSQEFCNLGDIVFTTKSMHADKSCMLIHRLLVVGDDIDDYDWSRAIWVFSTRCHPGRDEYSFEDVSCHPLLSYMSRASGTPRRGGKLVSDCLLATEYQRPQDFRHADFETAYPENIELKVSAGWKSIG